MGALKEICADRPKYEVFVVDSIVQCLMMLREKEVQVRCMERDRAMVNGLVMKASMKYVDLIKAEADVSVTCNVRLDDTTFLDESVLGGVFVLAQGGKITVS